MGDRRSGGRVGRFSAGTAEVTALFIHGSELLLIGAPIVLGVGRDLLAERRVHKVYLHVLPILIVGQSLAVYIWRHNPSWWRAITHAIMG